MLAQQMDASAHKKLLLPVFICGCLGIAWLIQSSLIFNSDASWLMLATKRLLAGGNYTHDFFEINPPMILYLYTPAALLVKITNLPTYIALRLFVFALAIVSLAFCARLMREIFPNDKNILRSFVLIAITIIILWLPMTEFGQREHLMIILTLPYFLLVALRLETPQYDKKFMALGIGIFAGLGFVIKPFFLAPFLLVEIFYATRMRRWQTLLRMEIGGIIGVFFVFGIFLLLLNRDYLTVIVPAITQFYYQKYGLPFTAMLLNEQAVLSYFAIALYFLRYRYQAQQTLTTILLLMVCGFLLVFFAQQTSWYYHVLPLLMTTSMLLALLFGSLALQKNISRGEYYALTVFAAVMGTYLCLHVSYISNSILFFPVAFFTMFGCLFLFLLTVAFDGNQFYKTILLAGGTLLAGGAFYKYLLHSPWRIHIFVMTCLLLILIFAFFIPQKTVTAKFKFTYLAVLGLIIFALPFYQGGNVYTYARAYKKLYGNLLTMMNEYPNKSVYFFSNIADFGFPALDYTRQTLASRFPSFGWLPALAYAGDQQTYAAAYHSQEANMNYYISAIVDDFNKLKPDVVFIDARNTNDDNKKTYFGNQQIDYLRFFSLNNDFDAAWQHYHYVKTVDGQPLFKFHIYERSPSV
jgi:hypothetical protein